MMKRRDILKISGLTLGYTLAGGAALSVMNGCQADRSPSWSQLYLTDESWPIVQSMADRIIPATDTPGAADALVDRYIDSAIHLNFTEVEKSLWEQGMTQLMTYTRSKYGNSYDDLVAAEQDETLQMMADLHKSDEDSTLGRLFKTMKELTVTGYFSSEIGATQALVHDPIPGPYQGCIPFAEVGGVYSLS